MKLVAASPVVRQVFSLRHAHPPTHAQARAGPVSVSGASDWIGLIIGDPDPLSLPQAPSSSTALSSRTRQGQTGVPDTSRAPCQRHASLTSDSRSRPAQCPSTRQLSTRASANSSRQRRRCPAARLECRKQTTVTDPFAISHAVSCSSGSGLGPFMAILKFQDQIFARPRLPPPAHTRTRCTLTLSK